MAMRIKTEFPPQKNIFDASVLPKASNEEIFNIEEVNKDFYGQLAQMELALKDSTASLLRNLDETNDIDTFYKGLNEREFAEQNIGTFRRIALMDGRYNEALYVERFKKNKSLQGTVEFASNVFEYTSEQVMEVAFKNIMQTENIPDTVTMRVCVRKAFESLLKEARDIEILGYCEDEADFLGIGETHAQYCERECV